MASPLAHDDPARIGAYELVARLGSGGMGTVYLGRSAGGRVVALKTVHAEFAAQPEFRTRFQLEADTARIVGGRYGATVVDADPWAEVPWLATEYVIGPPLDDAVALSGPLPEHSVRALGAALCQALGQLHRSDVVHRDLKPSNILLTAAGPKLIDFGIARALGDDRLTRTGAAVGTPAFMSPEQATGQEHPPAGDVFALAGVLLFAATGHGPFGGGSAAELLYRVRYSEPDLDGLPETLRPVLERCLAKEAAHRPGVVELAGLLHDGGGEFADHLPDPVLTDIAQRGTAIWRIQPQRLPAPSYAGTSSPRRETSRPSRRKILSLAGGGALALGAAGGGWAWLSSSASPGESATAAERSTRSPGEPPRMAWDYRPGEEQDVPLAAAGSLVAVSSGNGLTALDVKTGEERWTNHDLVNSYNQQLVGDGKRLYVAVTADDYSVGVASVNLTTGNADTTLATFRDMDITDTKFLARHGRMLYLLTCGGLYSKTKDHWFVIGLDLATGRKQWQREVAGPNTYGLDDDAFASATGSHVVLTLPATATARDARTGKKLWSRALPAPRTTSECVEPGVPALSDRLAVFGSGELVALRLSDGKVAWRFGEGRSPGKDVEKDDRYYGDPTIHDGVVYVCEMGKRLLAIDLDTGKLLWEERGAAPPTYAVRPVVGKKYIYTAPEMDNVWAHAVDRRSHTAAWSFQGPNGNGWYVSDFLSWEGRLISHRGGVVCAIPLE
ncbi:protein kinase domain-containing protein [Streptomyces sclerotialus]|uniref:protein kinase domain-containing protein n=1 Tax=Streptomyces sclerotialus TaxID=1957 RepID=UPI0004CB8063